MAYVKTNWQNGVTPVNADNMNKIEDGVANALAKPDAVLASNELVGVGTNGEQIRVQLGEGLTLEGTGSPYTLKASGGSGGGGFTPRFIYGVETLRASRFDITNGDYYINCKVKAGARDLISVTFTANVNCYVIIQNTTGTPVSIGKAMSAGESISKNLDFATPSGLTVRVYPTAEYDSLHTTIGVLTLVEG